MPIPISSTPIRTSRPPRRTRSYTVIPLEERLGYPSRRTSFSSMGATSTHTLPTRKLASLARLCRWGWEVGLRQLGRLHVPHGRPIVWQSLRTLIPPVVLVCPFRIQLQIRRQETVLRHPLAPDPAKSIR